MVDEFGSCATVGVVLRDNIVLAGPHTLTLACSTEHGSEAHLQLEESPPAASECSAHWNADESAAQSSSRIVMNASSARAVRLRIVGRDDTGGGKRLIEPAQTPFTVECTATVSYAPAFSHRLSIGAVNRNKPYPWIARANSTSEGTVRGGSQVTFEALGVFGDRVTVVIGSGQRTVVLNGSTGLVRLGPSTLTFTAPDPVAVCPSKVGCDAPFTITHTVKTWGGGTAQLSISCPHDYCPGDGRLSFSAGTEFLVQPGAVLSPTGLPFYDSCEGFPLDGTSTCRTVANASKCALRTCSLLDCTCAPCPHGAFCPSGPNLWPQPGFWARDQRSGVQKCAPPAEVRCPGYAGTSGSVFTACSQGYAGVRCSFCDRNYFKEGRVCLQCYDSESAKSRYLRYIALFGGLAALVLAITFVTMREAKKRGATSAGEVGKKAKEFAIWAVILLQTLTQVATAGSDLPAAVRSMTNMLKIVQIDFSYVHPDCSSAVPRFGVEAATFVYVLSTLGVLVVLFAKKMWKFLKQTMNMGTRAPRRSSVVRAQRSQGLSKLRHNVRSFCFTSLALLYAPAMNFAFRTVLCQGDDDAHAGSRQRAGLHATR